MIGDDGEALPAFKYAKRQILADGIGKNTARRVAVGDTAAMLDITAGFTPEKKTSKKAKAWRTGDEPERSEAFLVLLCCHMANDSTFQGRVDCFTQKSRLSSEDKSTRPDLKWYRDIAADMVNVDFVDDYGNAISFPSNHANDDPAAPASLHEALDSVNLGLSKRELHARYGEDTTPLENVLSDWLLCLASENTVRITLERKSSMPPVRDVTFLRFFVLQFYCGLYNPLKTLTFIFAPLPLRTPQGVIFSLKFPFFPRGVGGERVSQDSAPTAAVCCLLLFEASFVLFFARRCTSPPTS